MAIYERAKRAADYILSRVTSVPETAIVLGSGLGTFGDSIERETVIDYGDIPEFPAVTVAGHKGRLIFGSVQGKRILAMQGRFHRYEGYCMEDVTLYVRVFALLGVRNLILTNAAGAINTDFKPGDLMLIEDHLSLFCDSPLTGKNEEAFGERFPSMSEAYSKELKVLAFAASQECGIPLQKGIYAYAKGPMYETPAEICALRALGADACGMSTVPETIVAVHSGLRVLGISCLTNMAAGLSAAPLSHSEVMETGKAAQERFKTLMNGIVKRI